MNDLQLFQQAASGMLDQGRRPIRISLGPSQRALEQLLLIHQLDIREGLMTGIHGQLTCLSSRVDLPNNTFLGLPISVQLVTDSGSLHTISAIVTEVSSGQSDGSLACYQLTIGDTLTVLEKRVNSRIFRGKNLPDILDIMMREWSKRSATLASTFDYDLSGLTRSRYPSRELTRQVNESDATFIRRLLRRDGANFFVKAGRASAHNNVSDAPVHTLVFFDDAMKLPQSTAGTVRYHRDSATEERDTIQLWTDSQALIAGAIERVSWDYKSASLAQTNQVTVVDQGKGGNDLGHLLTDSVIDAPHAGDSWADYDRLGKDRILAHELRAQCVHGAGSVRDFAVGHWFALSGHPTVDPRPPEQRQYIVTSLHHRADNNLPKKLDERARSLLDASARAVAVSSSRESTAAMTAAGRQESGGGQNDTRYENSFTCALRGVPLAPPYDPRVDLPVVHPVTALVVGPKGEEVFCDQSGRIRVQIQGLSANDHAHAQGAGTNGDETDSAPVRVLCGLAGPSFGENTVPRIGMEVLLDHIDGDPDRPVVIGVLPNGPNSPAAFSHAGSLPGNRYVSGRKTKEISGGRYNQLRFDDTPQEISSQIASEHAFSQLNLGYLTQPRVNGVGEARGEGAELRTDAAASLRAAKGILLTTYARSRATGQHLDRNELTQLLQECTELFKSLGDYAGQHGGQVADTAGQDEVYATFKGWTSSEGQTQASASASSGSPALIALGAKAGSVNLTPKTHVTYAGENIDQVAQQHLQMVSGQRFTVSAGQGAHVFGRGAGVQAIAGEGPMVLQAQQNIVSVTAQKGINISSVSDEIVVSGKSIRLVAEDGSYIQIGGGVKVGSNGTFTAHTNGHDFLDPDTQHVAPPAFSSAGTDQKFRLRYPGTETPDQAHPVPNRQYAITLTDGREIKGISDSEGLTDLLSSDAMHIAHIKVFDAQG